MKRFITTVSIVGIVGFVSATLALADPYVDSVVSFTPGTYLFGATPQLLAMS